MEKTFKNTNDFFESLFEYANAPIVVWDPEFKITRFNHACEALTGKTAAEVVGKPVEILFPEEFKGKYMEEVRKTAQGERWKTLEIKILHTSGAVYSVIWNSATIFGDDGKTPAATIAQGQDITECKQAKESLWESEERFHTMIEAARDIIWTLDSQGNVNYINKQGEEISHHKPVDIVGKKYPFDFLEEDLPKVREAISQTLQGKPQRLEARIRLSDSTILFLSIIQVPLYRGGIISGMVCFGRDINERKRTEKALKDTNDFLENLLNYANAPVIVWDPEFKITRFNHAFEALTGKTAAEVVGKSVEILFPKEMVNEYMEQIRKTATGEHWEIVEIKILHTSGAIRTVLWNSATLFAADGKTPTATIAQGQDITERKEAEKALKDTNDFLENLLNYANAPVIVWDPEFKITRFNHAFEALTGKTATEVIGKTPEILFPKELVREYMEQIRKTATGERWEVVEIKILHTNGTIRTVLWNSATIFAADGKTPTATIAQGQDITERKEAEKALKDTNDFLENLLNYANAPVIVWDPEFKITRFNHAFEALTGKTAAEVIGKTPEILFPRGLVQEYMEQIRKTATGERWEVVEIKILHTNGSIRTVLWNSATIFAADGKTPTATIAQGQDITERKEIEESLKESEDKFRTIIEHSNDMIWTLDTNGNFLFFNKRAEEITGYELKDWVGKSFVPLILKNDLPKVGEIFVKTLNGESLQYEVSIYSKKGQLITLLVSSTPLLSKGTIIGTTSFGKDITDRKNMERTALELRDRDEAILSSIADAVFAIDKNGKIMLFNEMAESLSGIPEKNAIGSHYKKIVSFIKESDGKPNYAFIDEAGIRNNESKKTSPDVIIRKDGKKIPIACAASPIKTTAGEVIGTVVVFRDVTHEREIDKAKTEFVSLASHQLRTPLTSINWLAEMLLRGDFGKLARRQKESMGVISNSGLRMAELISALLNVSRLELGTFAINPKSVALRKMAEETLAELEHQIKSRKLKIIKDYPKKSFLVNADPVLMKIIWQNLLSNAVNYSPPRTTVTIRIGKDEKNFLLTVSDQGIGIPKADQPKIFTKLFRSGNAQLFKTDGTGLGLYITKLILDAIDGKIWFESNTKEQGSPAGKQGTTFYATIPLKGMKAKEGSKSVEAITSLHKYK